MVDARAVGTLLFGAVVFAGCCVAVVRAFFHPRPDGTALPLALWWLAGMAAISASAASSDSASAAFASAAAIAILLLVGQALGGLWWRGKAMQSEIEELRELHVSASAGSKSESGRRSASSPGSLAWACAKTARAYDLTRREEDVLRLLAEGCSTGEVAEQLVVSPNTVKSHMRRIYRKMGVNGKQGLKERIEEACLE